MNVIASITATNTPRSDNRTDRHWVTGQLAAAGIDHRAVVATYDALVHAPVRAAWLTLAVTGVLTLAMIAATIVNRRRRAVAEA